MQPIAALQVNHEVEISLNIGTSITLLIIGLILIGIAKI